MKRIYGKKLKVSNAKHAHWHLNFLDAAVKFSSGSEKQQI